MPRDSDGDRIYMLGRDLEQKWMDVHRRETGTRLPLD
jgi:hypothetical protein